MYGHMYATGVGHQPTSPGTYIHIHIHTNPHPRLFVCLFVCMQLHTCTRIPARASEGRYVYVCIPLQGARQQDQTL